MGIDLEAIRRRNEQSKECGDGYALPPLSDWRSEQVRADVDALVAEVEDLQGLIEESRAEIRAIMESVKQQLITALRQRPPCF